MATVAKHEAELVQFIELQGNAVKYFLLFSSEELFALSKDPLCLRRRHEGEWMMF